AGLVSVAGLAPFFLWPVFFVTVTLLVWLLDGAALAAAGRVSLVRTAAWTGWCFGFGYFLGGLYWVGFSFLVEADRFAWLLPFAVTLLPAGMAIYFALACAAACAFWRPGAGRIFLLALCFAVAEYLRGHLFSGFPWNAVGYWVTGGETLMQWASVFGVYALALFAMHIFAMPALLWPVPGLEEPRPVLRFSVVALAGLLIGAAGLYGQWRLSLPAPGEVENVRLRVVQPNIPQAEKWLPQNRASVFQRYLDVSRAGPDGDAPGLDTITHLVWPESALPFLLADHSEALRAIGEALPDHVVLLNGQIRAEERIRPDNTLAGLRAWNSLFVMNGEGRLLEVYDKLHLVPFGEYLPFQELMESVGIEQLTRMRGGFEAGANPRRLEAPGLPPFVPLICYEIIFPDAIAPADFRPRWMLNVTNDAWFGNSTGPYQHLHQARVRAVEQGLPLVRAANTGVSAVMDAYGRTLGSLRLGMAGVIDAPLPGALPPTPYVRAGRLVEGGIAMLYALLAALCLRAVRPLSPQPFRARVFAQVRD
ncbi:MAG: apolipoprotein N-acyltransferase, partial [Hyphomicrobiales bacterium]